jgi:hypothetical protein
MRKTLIGVLIGIGVFGMGVWSDRALKRAFLYPKPAISRVFTPGIASRITQIIGQPGEGYRQPFESSRGEELTAGVFHFETATGARTALADAKRLAERQIEDDPHSTDASGIVYERAVFLNPTDSGERYTVILYDGARTFRIVEAPNRFVIGDFEAYLAALNGSTF